MYLYVTSRSKYSAMFLFSFEWLLITRYRTAVLDEQVVGEMATHFGVSRQTQVCCQKLIECKQDEIIS